MTEPEASKSGGENEELRTVAVAGATGNAGREIVRALVNRNVSVRALVRDPERLGAIRDRCAEVRIVQVTDRESVRGSLDGVDAVVSALGKTHQKEKVSRRRVDVDANVNLFREASHVGVKRFCLISVAWASVDHPVTMIRMKGEVENALRESGIPCVIVQPSGFFSDMWEVFEMCKSGTLWGIGDGKVRFNPISMVDLGDYVAEALLDEANVGQALPIGGSEVFDTFGLAEVCGRVLGRSVKVRRVPLWLAKAGVGLVKPFSQNAFELGEFFVGNTEFGMKRGNDALVPRFGTRKLEDYLRERYEAERVTNR